MATITFTPDYFYKLVGKKLNEKELEHTLTMLGAPMENMTPEEVEVELTPNRPDWLCVEGLARSVRCFLGLDKKPRAYKAKKSVYKIHVDDKTRLVRPYIAGAAVRNVRLDDDFIKSLMQMQEKIHLTFGRKRKKVAIGIYDLDTIGTNITYTTVNPDEFKFIPLDTDVLMSCREILQNHPKGVEYAFTLEGFKEFPIVMDKKGTVMSMPPIINSDVTRVKDSTKNLFVEVTGTDEKAVNQAINVITTALIDKGSTVEEVEVKYSDRKVKTPDYKTATLDVDKEYIEKLLGMKFSDADIKKNLLKMGVNSKVSDGVVTAEVPCYRTDIMHPMDIVEEVAIGHGYDNFEATLPRVSTMGRENQIEKDSAVTSRVLLGLGYQEVHTFVMTSKESMFDNMKRIPRDLVEVEKSASQEYTVVRDELLPSLMDVLRNNRNNEYPQRIFEAGDVVVLDKSPLKSSTIRHLSAAFCGSDSSFASARSVLEAVSREMDFGKISYKETEDPSYINGRVAKVFCGDKEVGTIGEIHPEVLENWGLCQPTAVFEIDLEAVLRD